MVTLAVLTTSLFSCEKEEEAAPVPVASFTTAGGKCTAPCEVSFTNASKNANAYSWSFGDGSGSAEANPKHQYAVGGTFKVILTATNGRVVDTTSQAIVIQSEVPPPVADFAISGGDCTAPCEVSFANASRNATAYWWIFGDGTTSADANPKHAYASGGTFNVTLIASGVSGKDTLNKPVTIAQPKPVQTPEQLLCGQAWVLTGFRVGSEDADANVIECRRDDRSKFNLDQSYVFDEGASKCDPADPQTSSGRWLFNESKTILTWTNGQAPYSYTVLRLTETVLELRYVDNSTSTPVTITITYSHP